MLAENKSTARLGDILGFPKDTGSFSGASITGIRIGSMLRFPYLAQLPLQIMLLATAAAERAFKNENLKPKCLKAKSQPFRP